MNRIHDIYRPVEERVKDYEEVEKRLDAETVRTQVSRCMNCGQAFCHGYGCPLGNLVPEQNRAVALGDDRLAYELLSRNSPFPEFTARICPALCESCCVHQLDEESVMVRQSEKHIIETAFERGWVVPKPPNEENGKSVAIIGAGPAGLSAAVTIRRRGYKVTVYEKRAEIGGLLRYGIPEFKLAKSIIDRRRKILEAEGIKFVTNVEIGKDIAADYLARANDALVIAIGTPAARDLKVPGRELKGLYLALDYLHPKSSLAKDKKVLVIGGGDTGSDCVGTAIRQGAKSVTQIEIMPKPPETRSATTPWPLWPYQLRTSSSHLEGCTRRWSLSTLRFIGEDGHVTGAEVENTETKEREIIEADLVLLSMGFTGVPTDHPIVRQLKLALTPRTTMLPAPERNIYIAGDSASGASLVVRAIASGRALPL